MSANDTIAAISTPPGANGIGIVRLSGPLAIDIADKIFISVKSKKPSQFRSHVLNYGYLSDCGARIDEALVSVMRAPKTYTREDIVEVNCHGGMVTLREALNLIVKHGARLAQPGEFTKRAFLNGRIDLMQAEAVLDVINSRTKESLRVAQHQLSGEASLLIKKIRASIMGALADIEADINFPEEELQAHSYAAVEKSLIVARDGLRRLIDSSDKGVILREGLTAVICGKPNVGKSSLMNSFLRQDRVIVAPIPGTTRDTIEEIVNVKGVPLKIVDTAGIIHADDELIRESVRRSKHYIEAADLILLVLDSSDTLSRQDMDIIDIVKDKKTLVVINKTDLPEALQTEEINRHLHDKRIIKISAKNKHGLEELEDAIFNMFWAGEITGGDIYLSNSRHVEAARNSLKCIEESAKGIKENASPEFISHDMQEAAQHLGIITGEVFTDELLDIIFSKFCIGK